MKKSIIAAGAASVALAAMPVLGAFADIQDTITVTVSQYCTFQSSAANDSYTASVAAGGLKEWTAAEDANPMAVACTTPYTITPTMTSLADQNLDASTAIVYSATPATTGSKTWSAAYTLSGDHTGSGAITSGSAITGSAATTSTDGDVYKISYKVGLDPAQPAGTYTGTATYVIAASN